MVLIELSRDQRILVAFLSIAEVKCSPAAEKRLSDEVEFSLVQF
jgi:hypothetical protein